MLQAKLKVIGKKHRGRLIPLSTPQFLVGREQDCQLRPASDMVSRHHCALTIDDYSVRLRDLGSTNGTFVNGNRIRGQVVLKPGDRIRIGKLVFELVILDKKTTESAGALIGGDAATALPDPMKEAADPDTAELSGFETMTDLPVTPRPEDAGTIPAVQTIGADPDPSSDTSMFLLPPDGIGVEQPVEGDTAVVSQEAIAPPANPAVGYPQQPGIGYQNPPGYGQVPQPYQPYPGQFPLQPVPYPTQGMPYPVAPIYPQPPMMYPGQQPGPMAAPSLPPAPLEEESSKLIEIPVQLPDPADTGAKEPEPPPPPAPAPAPAPTEESKDDDADTKSENVLNPSEKAADIIRQHLQRRPDEA